MSGTQEDRKEACKTYIEQTKLLVTLASAFIVAPAALIPLFKEGGVKLSESVMVNFFWSESLFVASVFAGYLVLGSIAGYQHKGEYNVYRPATFVLSWVQILTYVAGLGFFVAFVKMILRQVTQVAGAGSA